MRGGKFRSIVTQSICNTDMLPEITDVPSPNSLPQTLMQNFSSNLSIDTQFRFSEMFVRRDVIVYRNSTHKFYLTDG